MHTGIRGWLVDLYDTVLTVDFVAVHTGMAQATGVPYEPFLAAAGRFEAALTTGSMTWSSTLAGILHDCGRPTTDGTVEELLDTRRTLLAEHTRVFPDAVELLGRLRAGGRPTALVSNSDDHARGLIERLGVDRLVDHVVLSCEIGTAKPDPGIYRAALCELDCPAGSAVMIDDQAGFCAGAVAIGMRAIQVHRAPTTDPGDGAVDRSADWLHVESLREVTT